MLPCFIISHLVFGILISFPNLGCNLARIESAIDAEGEKEDHDHHDHHHHHDEKHDHKHGKSF